jgi:hypothetical protein
LIAKPMVDGLEKQLGEQAQVVRLNTTSMVGQMAAVRYQIRVLPTFVVVDTNGAPVYGKGGMTSKDDLLQVIQPLLSGATE